MPTTAASPLHLDLPAHHCSHLVLYATLTVNEATVESLRRLVKGARQSEVWPWVFADSYRVEGEQYNVAALLYPAKQTGALRIQIEFSGGGRVHGRAPDVQSLLDIVSAPDMALDVDCVAHFDYEEDEGVSTIPLPVAGPDSVALPEGRQRFEVRGLRITQLDEEGSIDSSIVIDRPTNAEFHHSVSYKRTSVVSPMLAGQLLERASDISRYYFKVKEKTSGTRATREGVS